MKTPIASARPFSWITAAIFGALALSSAAVSYAADSKGVPQVVVPYADLNLSSPQGAGALYARIATAAKKVCHSREVEGRNLPADAWVLDCVHSVIADAVIRVGEPELFAVYNAKNRAPLPDTGAIAQAR